VLTPLVIRLAFRWGVLDDPAHRKTHPKPTPLLGGLAVAAATWLPILALLFAYENRISIELRENLTVLGMMFVAGVSMVALGVVDDRQGLTAKWKFLVQVPLALALLSAGVHFDMLSVPFVGSIALGWFAPVLTVLWLVGITNALNLIDGVDGLAAGVALFVALTNGVIAAMHNNAFMAVTMFSLAGACTGFLRYNWNPARIFLGDSGSLFLGITLAVSSALSVQKATVAVSMLVPVLVLGYPILDTVLAMARRLWHGKSMFSGDSSHLHHRLEARGFSSRRTVMILYGVTALCCLLALATVMERNAVVAVGFGVMLLIGLFGLRSLGYLDVLRSPASRARRAQFNAAYHFANYLEARIDLAENRDVVFGLLCEARGELGYLDLEMTLQNNGCAGYWRRVSPAGAFAAETAPAAHSGDIQTQVCPFRDTGLTIRIRYPSGSSTDELHLEKRQLMARLAAKANRRLHQFEGSGRHNGMPSPESVGSQQADVV